MSKKAHIKRIKLTEFDNPKDVKEFLDIWTRDGGKPPVMTVTKTKKGHKYIFYIEVIRHSQPKLHRPL